MNKLKKIIAMVLTLTVFCTLYPVGVLASTVTDPKVEEILATADGNYEYKIIDGEITITTYEGNQKEVIVPKRIDEKKVTSIGEYAFSGCSSLTDITIPDSVTSIGSGAFRGCSSLTSITIPDSVTSIGEYAFSGCSSLTSITIPDNVTSIGYHVFEECSSLTSITIPDSVTSIDECAFYGCSSLTNITIPDSVMSIGHGVFGGCSSVTSITIPDSVTSIGGFAFSKCSSLTSITIPDSVTSIGRSAFSGCSSLTNITIPDSVTSIGDSVFYECSSLTSIMIPDSVTSIGVFAFYKCSSLTSITIPDSVTSIGVFAFSGCSSLTSITIPDSVTRIGDSAFGFCFSLTSITIPGSVTSIGDSVFHDCPNLKDVYFEGSKEQWNNIEIGSNNWSLTNATIHFNSSMSSDKDEDLPQQQNTKNNVYYINSADSEQINLDALPYGYDESKVSMESLKPYVGKYAYIEFDASTSPKVIGIKAVESSIGTITEYVDLNSSGGNDSIEVDHKEYQVSNKSTSIIDGRNSRILYHTINDKIVGVEFLRTSIGYYNGITENGEKQSITVSNKEYSINSASCISDKIQKGKLVVFSVGAKNNDDKISPFLLEVQELQGTPSVWVYVSDDTFSTEIGQELDLYCALHIGDYVIPNWEKPSFAVGNDKLVTLSNYEQTDLGYHCKIKGVSVGQTTLTITDTETGAHQSFPITVKEKSESMSYTCRINEVPDYTIESGWDKGLQTNIYNVNGLYVNKYKYEKNEAGGYEVSFDVYNTLYMHGSVDVYDKDGRWIQSAKINKRTGITSLYATGESLLYLINDAVYQKTFTYEATTYTKKTGIKISVPEDGYFVISTNYADSPGVMLYNSIDFIMLGLEATVASMDKVDYNLSLQKYLSEAKEKKLHEVLQDSIESKTKKFLSDQLKEGMAAGFGEAADVIALQGNEILTAEKLDGNFYKDVLGVGGDVLQNYMGPAGAALKVMFGIEKYTDYSIQIGQICKGISKSEIVISTASIPSIHGITVKPENPVAIGEAVLQVFRVSEKEEIASSFENAISTQTNQYEIYNICFTTDNVEQEINTNVTVRIPIPKMFDKNKSAIFRQERDGSWTKLNSKIDGNYLVFETNHFSLYAIAEDKTATTMISSITLNMKNGAVTKSGSLKLNATIAPSNATDPTLIWSSDTPSVATVDQTGLVTAISVGKATITAKAQDGSGVKASCVVEVTGGSNNGGNNIGGGNSSGSGDASTGGSNSSGGGNTSTGGDGSSGGGNSSTGGSGSSGGGNTSTGGNGSSGGGNTSTGGNGSSGGGSTSSGGNNTHTGGSSTTPGTGNTSTADEPTIKVLYYIVNFDKNGGKNLSRRKMTLLQDDSLGILPKVERKNYKFLGWYTQPAGGTKVTQKTVLNVSTTVHAHWEKIAKPSKEQITSLNSKKAGSVAVKYKKLSGIKGYEIAYSTNKQFTSASTKRVVAGSTGKTLTKLKSGKTYYVKVRAYKTDSTGKKIYGAYSNVRSVQVK